MKNFTLFLFVMLFIYSNNFFCGIKGTPMDPKKYVGNVSGIIIDKDNGFPISFAAVNLVETADSYDNIITNINQQIIPADQKFNPKRITDNNGKFLINFVPTPDSGKPYSLLIKARGYESQLIKKLFVPVGALSSPELIIKLKKGDLPTKILGESELRSMVSYNHESSFKNDINIAIKTQKRNNSNNTESIKASIFATKEGLEGHTTANGHIIQTNDHFCALPSSDVLNSSDNSTTFNVTIYYGANVQSSVPVWDIGPWNIHDDYWVPESERSIYQYLTQGGSVGGLGQYVPEAAAAFTNGFNGGYGEPIGSFSDGQVPNNPNGIDLATGTFNNLGLNGNDYVKVIYNWQNTNSVINEDIKQSEHWFGSVTIEEKDGGYADIHIMNNQTIEVDPGCTLTLNSFVRLKIDAGSTLILDNGMIKNFSVGAGIDVAPGGHLIDNTPTGICNTCPPYAPSNLSATIVGQNVILTWATYTD
jgi:hypothetical protein